MLRLFHLLGALALVAIPRAPAAEVIPPKPAAYFNDYAGVVSKETAGRFNEQLAQFERETSNQVVVAVFQKMQSDTDIADYTQRVAQTWGVGQADKRNGAVLFVFIGDRKMHIQAGYGLEGALPDVTAFDITERHIKPLFRAGDYEAGLATGIDLMLKAARGEYTGTGNTVAEGDDALEARGWPLLIPLLVLSLFIYFSMRRGKRGWGYSGAGGPFAGGWSSGGGGGWSSGGSSSGGGSSGFSGGGGSFGGGGGGSSW